MEEKLTYRHTGINAYRNLAAIEQFERDTPRKPGMNSSRGFNNQTHPAQGGFPRDISRNIVGEREPFESGRKYKPAWMEHKRMPEGYKRRAALRGSEGIFITDLGEI